MKKIVWVFFAMISLTAFAQSPKSVQFSPTNYYSLFSATTKPVLTIRPGDTIHTSSVDCNGFDLNGIKKAVGAEGADSGNPLTGPFYVEGAEEGDIVQVTFVDIQFSRNTAFCFPYFHERSMPAAITSLAKNTSTPIIWDLDIQNHKASIHNKTAHLANFDVAIRPFLGCVGLAAPKGQKVSTEDAGPFGGNMDFTRITKSASVYLPVYNQGGLLYLGDGHAAQGDGEINWTALETSLNFSFVVKLIKHPKVQISYPRIEDAEYIMTAGISATLDSALQIATTGIFEWLQETYHLTVEEATQVMGSSLEYKIAEIVDPQVEIIAMIKKSALRKIKP